MLDYSQPDSSLALSRLLTVGQSNIPADTIDPGAILIISSFYTRTEVATRIAVMYSANIASTAFAGLIAAAIFPLHGKLGYSGWQWLFIIQGALTGFFAICCYPLLPDRPLDTSWLNEEERQLAHSRLFRDEVDRKEPGSVWSGFKQATADPRVWLFCLIQNLHCELKLG